MGSDEKSDAGRLAEIVAWQMFKEEIDTWAFKELTGGLIDLLRKVREPHSPPAGLGSIESDVDALIRVIYARRERLRTYRELPS
ncbi:hypothetical protein AB0H76_03885 [Nocardia sp. NPDC050712]|uniref:hypothetical protein n=1 Tax=Nocardia sp. NPDC050712 TaxID=3155518 RepID=UPI0033F057E7